MSAILVDLLGLAAAGYLALLAALWLGQRRLLFKPDPAAPPWPADAPAGLRQIEVDTADGQRLAHWYHPPAAPGAGVVVVFHGNAGNRADVWPKYRAVTAWGYGLLLVDYRGYGGNPGRPSEAGLLADGRAVLDWLAGQGVAPSGVALYGESLGSGVATALAAEYPVAALVLEAPFTSVAELAQEVYWYVPARRLVRDPFESVARIGKVRAPILILHGGQDATIPPGHGARLARAAPERARFLRVEPADHVSVWDHGGDAAVRELLAATLPPLGYSTPSAPEARPAR
jgi:hypothetical protein